MEVIGSMVAQLQFQEQHESIPIDTLIHGDALSVLKTLPDNCVDAIVADPPSSINFMNKSWDSDKGGRTQWVAWLASILSEAKRCLRPGGHALVWSLPRTSHWTALALEDAGFEIRDCLYNLVSGDTALYNFIQSLSEEQQHAFMQVIDAQREPSGIMQIFGSGFPKSANISIMIDKLLGKEREVIDYIDGRGAYDGSKRTPREKFTGNAWNNGESGGTTLAPITKPATPESEAYAGYGTHLKPSVENWWLVRKPLAAHSIAENVLEYGTGGLNIDASRISGDVSSVPQRDFSAAKNGTINKIAVKTHDDDHYRLDEMSQPHASGRFPSHLLLSHTIFCQQSGTKRVQANGPAHKENETKAYSPFFDGLQINSTIAYRDEDGMETVTNWICDESCPVKILDTQGGQRPNGYRINPSIKRDQHQNAVYGKYQDTYTVGERGYKDQGGPSRYFKQFPALDVPPYIYAGKASRKDRNAGCEDLPEKQGFDKNTSKRIAHINHSTGETTYTEYHPSSNKNTHPTVKSVHGLMRYLVRLVTPPNGIVLDMFAGSGSTLCAAIHEGFHFIGIEKEQEYVNIANSRINHARKEVMW